MVDRKDRIGCDTDGVHDPGQQEPERQPGEIVSRGEARGWEVTAVGPR